MSSTDFVAWWGAILSSIIFLWDIYKYRNAGPKLRFHVQPGMIMLPSADKRTFIQTEVTNYGDRPTTLTNITFYYFEKPWSWARLRNRPTTAGVLNNPNPEQPFPCELKAGGVWRGLTEQKPELEAWGRKGALYFDLYHSHSTKPLRQRVTFPQESKR
jgi:hypothetical protein